MSAVTLLPTLPATPGTDEGLQLSGSSQAAVLFGSAVGAQYQVYEQQATTTRGRNPCVRSKQRLLPWRERRSQTRLRPACTQSKVPRSRSRSRRRNGNSFCVFQLAFRHESNAITLQRNSADKQRDSRDCCATTRLSVQRCRRNSPKCDLQAGGQLQALQPTSRE